MLNSIFRTAGKFLIRLADGKIPTDTRGFGVANFQTLDKAAMNVVIEKTVAG